ncbi:MAG: hypothetical protein WC121_10730 [Candidatus Kapaibacterium sp.]
MIKQQKQALITALVNAGFSNTNVLSKIFPKSIEEAERLSLDASGSNATIYVCYSGRDWNETARKKIKAGGIPGGFPALLFSLFVYSQHIDSDEDNDIETLTDKIAEVLYKNGYTLLSDQASPVPTSNGDLYEIIFNVSINQRYDGGTV